MADHRRTVASSPSIEVDPIVPNRSRSLSADPTTPSSDPTASVLICDDRPTVGLELSRTFRILLPSIAPVTSSVVSDGFALVDAFEARPADVVLIGIHSFTTVGVDAINLLLGIHPQANTIVYGSVADVGLLAAAYARGAGGLLVWEPTIPGRRVQHQQITTAPGCAGQALPPKRSHRR